MDKVLGLFNNDYSSPLSIRTRREFFLNLHHENQEVKPIKVWEHPPPKTVGPGVFHFHAGTRISQKYHLSIPSGF